ncbi:MAG: hypothetical protein JWR38_2164 [Mucilaginibacter sp.]|nr:hypothetical protein [Mucilaginibacter sp.]
MESSITKIVLGSISSILILMIWSCQQTTTKTSNDVHQKPTIKNNCFLQVGVGQGIISSFGCTNCHLSGNRHLSDSTYLSAYGKNKTWNFNELGSLDSGKIVDYLIKGKHKGMYKDDERLEKLNECDVQNIVYYLHKTVKN